MALRHSRLRVLALLATGVAALALAAPAAQAGTANGGLPGAASNPLAHIQWGVPQDSQLWSVYEATTGTNQALLGRIALQPQAVWLGWETKVAQIQALTAATVASSQNGNPNVLTELATFELNPWEKKAANGVDKPAVHASWNVKSDEAWYRNMAAGIGTARALVIEQVDLPVALKIPSTAPARIDTYAARVLSANPHTTVYIDGGTFGWLSATRDAELLISNGIRYARGFALDDTDYDPTATEDTFGAQVVAALAKLGVKGKHFIVNTDENGEPYKPSQVKGRGINDAPVCHGRIQTACQRTGIPPTTNVASPKWHLGAKASTDARRYSDGYVWSGQPWDVDAGPFQTQRALWLGENGEY
ncbi:MAG TPA: glycoside hydrolase family 6 protein [Solirubrobacteraceae bacterium]|nr:glycoside hydrolase family 6 protein [Solirubrobacteraceae bacterium]